MIGELCTYLKNIARYEEGRAQRAYVGLLGCSFILFMITISHAWANIPAAYLACEGANPKEACVITGPQYGACLRDTLCQDPEETAVDECLLCVDACWDLTEGSLCIRPWTGEEGRCEAQAQCTDKPETSFLECMRCIEDINPIIGGETGGGLEGGEEVVLDRGELRGCIPEQGRFGTGVIGLIYILLAVFMRQTQRP